MSKYTDNNASRGIKLNPSAACVSEYFLKYRKKYAFTLAEVLITIGVIGVVAALTIPNLMTNVRASENAALFKKRSSQLQNALKRIGAEEEQTIYGNINASSDSLLPKMIARQFPGSKIIDRGRIVSKSQFDKFHKAVVYKTYGGGNYRTDFLDDGTIIVDDDFFIFINNDSHQLTNLTFIVDINGYKKPNQEGYDFFKFCLGEGDKIIYDCSVYTQKAHADKDYFRKLPKK